MADFAKVEGLENLDKALAALGSSVGFKALRGGMMNASRPMFLAAKANASSTGIKNEDSGATAAAMSRFTKKITKNITKLSIGPKNKLKRALAIYNQFHGTNVKRLNHFHLLEFGSVHGGAQPFMRPAWEAHKAGMLRTFGVELAKSIEKVRKKHAR